MAQYYFVGSSLPSLSFDTRAEIRFSELDSLLKENLSKEDYEKVGKIRTFFDLLNLRALWKKEPLDQRGQFNKMELEEALIKEKGLPNYVFFFLANYPNEKDRLAHFSLLLVNFFKTAEKDENPFLRSYFQFERQLRLILTLLRSKKLNRDLNEEFQYEDLEEEVVGELLNQSEQIPKSLLENYQEVENIFIKYSQDPWLLDKTLDLFRFNFVENLVDFSDHFSIERILAYVVQLLILEKWSELEHVNGLQIIDQMFN